MHNEITNTRVLSKLFKLVRGGLQLTHSDPPSRELILCDSKQNKKMFQMILKQFIRKM